MSFGWDSIISAAITTAGEFILGGGPAEQAPQPKQIPLQGNIAGTGGRTTRVSRPETPSAPGVADVDEFYAEWFARMRKFSNISAVADTGGPRTLGTQARRN